MSHLHILVTGAAGRMGKEVVQLIEEADHLKVAAAVDRVGQDKDMPKPDGGEVEVIVDFSSPDLLRDVLRWSQRSQTPLVSGTTGLSQADFGLIAEVSQTVPVLWAPNMSLGVAVMNSLIKQFQKVTEQFDFQIEEFHHRHKKDHPSGTALQLQQSLEQYLGESVEEPKSIRGGGIFGIHKFWAMGEEETLCVEHTALNRRVFARGALQAAEWLVQRPPGQYHMKDLLA